MYLRYDEAVQAGLNAYRMLDYAESCRSAFRVVSREFKEYMETNGLSYSQELVQQWIKDSKEHWNNYKLKSSRKAMSVLADIMEHSCVSTSLQTKIERTSPYTQLPCWSRTLLDNYLSTLTCTYGTPYLTQIRNSCSSFFLFLKFASIKQPSEITHGIVKSFFISDIHTSSKAKDRCNNEISHCLKYMVAQGLIPKTVRLALNKFVIPDMIIVAELPESERNIFSRFFNSINRSKTEYEAAAKKLADIHKNRKYSSTIQKSNSQATRDFRVFMDANLFAYSNDLALEWLEFQRTKWSRAKYLAYRRVLLSINEILCTGTLSTSCFSTHEQKYSLPGWGKNLLSQYLRERKQEGCAGSTLNMINSSCSRFIIFLDNYGIVSVKGITPEVIRIFRLKIITTQWKERTPTLLRSGVLSGFLPERGWYLRHSNLRYLQKWPLALLS